MLSWLDNLPDMGLVGLSIVLAVVLVLLTGLVARRMGLDSPRARAALEAYKIIVTFSAILLSFSLVQAQATMRAVEAAVSREAGVMNQLDRVLQRYDTPATTRIRPLLRDYIRSVAHDEWPALQGGTGSPATAQRLATLTQALQQSEGGVPTKPTLYAEMLRQADSLSDLRQDRIDISGAGLPPSLWQATGVLCLLLLVLSALINVPGRFIAIGGHASAIAVLASLVFAVDLPFRGQTSVSPAPIARVLATVADRGP